jgi:CheY-like chemotaxis protein
MLRTRRDAVLSNQRTRVLVVDDNAQDSGELVHLFESFGHEASVMWSGRDALGELASQRFDLLLVDQFVADMYVGTFIEQVLLLPNHPRVVILNSIGNPTPVKYDESLGECMFIEKGEPDQIYQTVRTAFPELEGTPLN